MEEGASGIGVAAFRAAMGCHLEENQENLSENQRKGVPHLVISEAKALL